MSLSSPSREHLRSNPHPYAVKTTSTGVLSRSNSTTSSASAHHHFVPSSPTKHRPTHSRPISHRYSSSLNADQLPRPLPVPPHFPPSPSPSPTKPSFDFPHEPVLYRTRDRRADTLPSASSQPNLLGTGMDANDTLPHDPRTWSPAELSTYLSSSLRVTSPDLPPLVAQDIAAFVLKDNISGKKFLRLTDGDLDPYALDQRWQNALLKSSRLLRQDSLRGRIWNTSFPTANDDDDDTYPDNYSSTSSSSSLNDARRARVESGASGRVKGMIASLERSSSPTKSLSSTSSSASSRRSLSPVKNATATANSFDATPLSRSRPRPQSDIFPTHHQPDFHPSPSLSMNPRDPDHQQHQHQHQKRESRLLPYPPSASPSSPQPNSTSSPYEFYTPGPPPLLPLQDTSSPSSFSAFPSGVLPFSPQLTGAGSLVMPAPSPDYHDMTGGIAFPQQQQQQSFSDVFYTATDMGGGGGGGVGATGAARPLPLPPHAGQYYQPLSTSNGGDGVIVHDQGDKNGIENSNAEISRMLMPRGGSGGMIAIPGPGDPDFSVNADGDDDRGSSTDNSGMVEAAMATTTTTPGLHVEQVHQEQQREWEDQWGREHEVGVEDDRGVMTLVKPGLVVQQQQQPQQGQQEEGGLGMGVDLDHYRHQPHNPSGSGPQQPLVQPPPSSSLLSPQDILEPSPRLHGSSSSHLSLGRQSPAKLMTTKDLEEKLEELLEPRPKSRLVSHSHSHTHLHSHSRPRSRVASMDFGASSSANGNGGGGSRNGSRNGSLRGVKKVMKTKMEGDNGEGVVGGGDAKDVGEGGDGDHLSPDDVGDLGHYNQQQPRTRVISISARAHSHRLSGVEVWEETHPPHLHHHHHSHSQSHSHKKRGSIPFGEDGAVDDEVGNRDERRVGEVEEEGEGSSQEDGEIGNIDTVLEKSVGLISVGEGDTTTAAVTANNGIMTESLVREPKSSVITVVDQVPEQDEEEEEETIESLLQKSQNETATTTTAAAVSGAEAWEMVGDVETVKRVVGDGGCEDLDGRKKKNGRRGGIGDVFSPKEGVVMGSASSHAALSSTSVPSYTSPPAPALGTTTPRKTSRKSGDNDDDSEIELLEKKVMETRKMVEDMRVRLANVEAWIEKREDLGEREEDKDKEDEDKENTLVKRRRRKSENGRYSDAGAGASGGLVMRVLRGFSTWFEYYHPSSSHSTTMTTATTTTTMKGSTQIKQQPQTLTRRIRKWGLGLSSCVVLFGIGMCLVLLRMLGRRPGGALGVGFGMGRLVGHGIMLNNNGRR